MGSSIKKGTMVIQIMNNYYLYFLIIDFIGDNPD